MYIPGYQRKFPGRVRGSLQSFVDGEERERDPVQAGEPGQTLSMAKKNVP